MHITLWIASQEAQWLKLPRTYLHLFQSLLYNLLPPEYAEFLHESGYRVDGRPMKLFAMGWPRSAGRTKVDGGTISLEYSVKFVITTPVPVTVDGLDRVHSALTC